MDKKLKIGIIGCGGIANGKHMPALKKIPEVEMVAFCDIVIERAEEAKDNYGVEDATVYEAVKKLSDKKDELICYKQQHGLVKALKALKKEFTFSIVEKGMNSLYLSVCFLHYKEEDIEYKAPLLLMIQVLL